MKLKILAISIFLAGTLYAQDGDSTLVVVAGQEASIVYNEGITELNGGNYKTAAEKFSEAVAADPKFPQANFNRGLAYLKLNLNHKALTDFTNAVALDTKNAKYYLGRAIALARLKNYDEALKMVKKAESLGYDQSRVKYFYGYVYSLQGDNKKAVQAYTEAVNNNKKYALAYCDLASAHLRAGNFKAALDDYNTALDIMPSASFVYVLRAQAKASQNNFSGAIADVNTAILIDRDMEYEYTNERANIYAKFKKYKQAQGDFKACAEKFPERPDTYIYWGNMLAAQKKYAEAQKYFTTALEKDPENVAAYNNRANVRELQFDLKGAAEDRQAAENLLNKEK